MATDKDSSCENARLQRCIYGGRGQLATQTGKDDKWFPSGATVMCGSNPHSVHPVNARAGG